MWQGLGLQAISLACERGGRPIFTNLNFSLHSGEALELRGPNGSGKSSLLRLLAGLLHPASGVTEFKGLAGDLPRQVHYIGHLEAVKPALSVSENLSFWSGFLGQSELGKGEMPGLATFQLEPLAQDQARLLSQGQRRRLALSRLVLVKRPIWLLDEPMVGLDQNAVGALQAVMEAHLAAGGLILAATHTPLGLGKSAILNLKAEA